MAILAIPRLGVSDLVFVEGTGPRDLTHGPGHLRSTVLPGQAGVSVVYGRVLAYGDPFAHLMRLQRGDKITVTTGQGISTYTVESFGTSALPLPDPTPNRLLLVTADGSIFPSRTTTVEVSGDLSSAAHPTPASWPSTASDENPLAGEVLLGGEDVYDPAARPADVRKRIGMVFQKPNPFPAMTIHENVASGLKLAGIKVEDKDAVVEDALRRAGLWNEVHRRTADYIHGRFG